MPVNRTTPKTISPTDVTPSAGGGQRARNEGGATVSPQSGVVDTRDLVDRSKRPVKTTIPTANEKSGVVQATIPVKSTGPRLTEFGEPLVTVTPRGLDEGEVERNPTYQAWDGTLPERGNGWYERWRSPSNPDKWTYNYTESYRNAKAGKKFVANRRLAATLPQIRKRYAADLRGDGMPQALALVVALIDQACFRIGNEDSMVPDADFDPEQNDPEDDGGIYGITTLKGKHLRFEGRQAIFTYYGKHHQPQEKIIACTPRIAKLLKKMQAGCPTGEEQLFRAGDLDVKDAQIRRYLKPFKATPKQFRTFHASRIAMTELLAHAGTPRGGRDEQVMAAAKKVQEALGHESPQMSLGHYIDPAIVEAFRDGEIEAFAGRWEREVKGEQKKDG